MTKKRYLYLSDDSPELQKTPGYWDELRRIVGPQITQRDIDDVRAAAEAGEIETKPPLK